MKKMIIFAAFVLLLAGCGHEHTWSEATCTEPKTCTECGETEGEPIAHTWSEATCTKAKTCSLCGAIEGNPLEHVWAEATFFAPKTCEVCNQTEGEPKPSYFAEHGVEVDDTLTDFTRTGIIYDPDNPETNYMHSDIGYHTEDCYRESGDDGYQTIVLDETLSFRLCIDKNKDIIYKSIRFPLFNIYDLYTGRWIPMRNVDGDDAVEYSTILNIDGTDYEISYTMENHFDFNYGDWIEKYDELGVFTQEGRNYVTYTFKVPEGYDGLVLGIRTYEENEKLETDIDYENIDESERYAFDDEENKNNLFFRLNTAEIPER